MASALLDAIDSEVKIHTSLPLECIRQDHEPNLEPK